MNSLNSHPYGKSAMDSGTHSGSEVDMALNNNTNVNCSDMKEQTDSQPSDGPTPRQDEQSCPVSESPDIKKEVNHDNVQAADEIPAADRRRYDNVQAVDGIPATARRGRPIKKPKHFSPDDMDSQKKPNSGSVKKNRRSGSILGIVLLDKSPVKKREVVDPKWLVPFQHGWRREVVFRNTYNEGRSRPADVYYYAPNGSKARSGPEITRKLQEIGSDLTMEHFTFVKEPICDGPEETVRHAGKAVATQKNCPVLPCSTKSPVMVKKHSPLVKSSLSLKQAAVVSSLPGISEADVPSSSVSEADVSPVSISEADVPPVSISEAGIPSSSASSSSNTPVISIKPELSEGATVAVTPSLCSPQPQKQHVAKKHTGPLKRRLADKTVTSTAKKYKKDNATMPRVTQRLCSMDCPSRQGIPPSLHCNVCMCMFHAECVGRAGFQRAGGFVCKLCKLMKKKIGDEPSRFMMTPSLTLGCTVTGGLPPLQPAPSLVVSSNIRTPPPLRLAPLAGLTNQPPSGPPPLTICSSATSTSRLDNRLHQTAVNITCANNSIDTVHNSTPINMPIVPPKDVNGQILALPNNVTSKLNMDNPISLNVNGQRYVLPPNCFVNTNEGAKVYLPQGYLPQNISQGPSMPINVKLNVDRSGDLDGQVLSIGLFPEECLSQTRKAIRSSRLMSNQSFIQPLNAAYDCMLHIFSYLRLPELLRSASVCRTWRKVASHQCLWRRINLRGCFITDWQKAAVKFTNTNNLDMRGLYHLDSNKTWNEFSSVLQHMFALRHIDFGQCPGSILERVADKLPQLQTLTAEFITDTVLEPAMWMTTVRLDIGKFKNLKDLSVLKLHGVCGLTIPSISFNGGLRELSVLTNLQSLSLTTLRNVNEEEFSFLSSLDNLRELELGDISDWKLKTYKQLSHLTKLESLRLEYGSDSKEGGLGQALLSLCKLKNLELIKYAMSRGLMIHLGQVKSLRSFSIWPDTEHNEALVNTYTFRCLTKMTALDQLDWGIMVDQAPPQHCSQDSNASSDEGKNKNEIAIMSDSYDLDVTSEQEVIGCQYISHQQLVDRLSEHLPDTKIRVFKVPILSPST